MHVFTLFMLYLFIGKYTMYMVMVVSYFSLKINGQDVLYLDDDLHRKMMMIYTER